MEIKLSDHFTYDRLIRFTLPSIGMSLFLSIYGVIDGLFISNFAGKMAFASVNIIWPFVMILGGLGAMIGVGGSALVAKTLGEGDKHKASRFFTMTMYMMVITSIITSVIAFIFTPQIAVLLGASDELLHDCVVYGRILIVFNIATHAQYTFQNFLVVAEKPTFGLVVTVIAGVTNIVLDWLFVAVMHGGVVGAGMATCLSEVVGGLIPLIWFFSKRNKSDLHFVKTDLEIRPILKACGNGVSEMLAGVSGSIIGILYNRQLMHYAGADGVAAYGVVMYAAWIFIAILEGYSSGSRPIVGYHFGAQNRAEMRNLLKKSLTLMIIGGVILTVLSLVLAKTVAGIFVGYDEGLMDMTVRALRICCPALAICGVSLYGSGFFTALNDGIVSAEISFLHSLVYPFIAITVMPMILQLDGVWLSLPVSELLAFITAVVFLIVKRKKYNY